VNFSNAQKFLLEHTYKFCHYISLRIINWSLLPCCKSRSLIPSFWWRDASVRLHFCIPWISHKQPCSDDFWIAQARHKPHLQNVGCEQNCNKSVSCQNYVCKIGCSEAICNVYILLLGTINQCMYLLHLHQGCTTVLSLPPALRLLLWITAACEYKIF